METQRALAALPRPRAHAWPAPAEALAWPRGAGVALAGGEERGSGPGMASCCPCHAVLLLPARAWAPAHACGCLAPALCWGCLVRGGQSGETLDASRKETDYFCMTRDENFNAWLQITNVFCCGTLIKLLLPAGVLSCCEWSVLAARPAPPPRHSDANWHCAHF